MSIGGGTIIGDSSYTCPSCMKTVPMWELHTCTAVPYIAPMPMPETSKERRITKPLPAALKMPEKDINWREYTPARPPEDGDYIVAIRLIDSERTISQVAAFKKSSYEWIMIDYPTENFVLTHYAKLDLP